MHSEQAQAFGRWQAAQKQLHALERAIADAKQDHRVAAAPGPAPKLLARAHQLRLEVDALFPAAMRELVEQVSTLKARRVRLDDLR